MMGQQQVLNQQQLFDHSKNISASVNAGGINPADISQGTSAKSQIITAQQNIQNEIMLNMQTLYQYKQEVLEVMKSQKYYNLNLEVISSATLQKGEIITLNPLGLFGKYKSMREQAENN